MTRRNVPQPTDPKWKHEIFTWEEETFTDKTGAVKKNLYHTGKVDFDGWRFDSSLELKRYIYLRDWQRCGGIRALVSHTYVEYPNMHALTSDLEVRGVIIGKYTPDFCYMFGQEPIVEDVKGYSRSTLNEEIRLRMRLFVALYGVKLYVVTTISGTGELIYPDAGHRTKKEK